MKTVSIDMHWMGGECRYRAEWATELDESIVAWGGVLAQGLLLGAAFAFVRTFNPPGGFVGDLMFPLIVVNAGLILFNVLPVGGLDGTRAWSLLPLLAGRVRRRRLEQRRDEIKREIDRLDADDSDEADDDEPPVVH